MRHFATEGRVDPAQHYFVPRTKEIADFINRVRTGKYIILFAPRQTGKTTFFCRVIDMLKAVSETESEVETTLPETFRQDSTVSQFPTAFCPIRLDFQVCRNLSVHEFYAYISKEIRIQIRSVFQQRDAVSVTPLSEPLFESLATFQFTNHILMIDFFKELQTLLQDQRVILMIDEFDGIPQDALSDFLYALRLIYLSDQPRCPHSVGIVGVKSITQLNYDRSVSPFNIQDEFHLPNFTREQVSEMIAQYTQETGQVFMPEVITSIHKQTGGQPVLVNQLAQILTETLGVPKNERITLTHFTTAHTQLLRGRNTNIDHLTRNIRRDPRFESLLMHIMTCDEGVDFNLDDEVISELATYGVIKEGTDGMCEILNPIYIYRILRAFRPVVNGLEDQYFPTDTEDGLGDYILTNGQIDMLSLLNNFKDFIRRTGFRIPEIPNTPQESVGRYHLIAYLDAFVRSIGGVMHIEVQTGRGRMDLILTHKKQKHIVETKIWRGNRYYQAGKRQLAAYLKSETVAEGFYVVFDHRQVPDTRVNTEIINDVTIHSYIIPVIQEVPSDVV